MFETFIEIRNFLIPSAKPAPVGFYLDWTKTVRFKDRLTYTEFTLTVQQNKLFVKKEIIHGTEVLYSVGKDKFLSQNELREIYHFFRKSKLDKVPTDPDFHKEPESDYVYIYNISSHVNNKEVKLQLTNYSKLPPPNHQSFDQIKRYVDELIYSLIDK